MEEGRGGGRLVDAYKIKIQMGSLKGKVNILSRGSLLGTQNVFSEKNDI